MKKLYRIIVVAIFMVAFLAIPVYAGDACSITGNNDPLVCGNKDSNEEEVLQGRIKNTLEVVYTWVGIIAVIAIVIGGIRYMTSAGNPEKIKSKNTPACRGCFFV